MFKSPSFKKKSGSLNVILVGNVARPRVTFFSKTPLQFIRSEKELWPPARLKPIPLPLQNKVSHIVRSENGWRRGKLIYFICLGIFDLVENLVISKNYFRSLVKFISLK
jgi:hypothetical protein